MIRNWEKWLKETTQEEDTIISAVGEQLKEWLNAGVSRSFRVTQVLTGHGCFGRYLCRIGREATRGCWHCDSPNNSARHTLGYCPSWDTERTELQRIIGIDLSLKAIVRALREEKGRKAVLEFCEKVMSQKSGEA
ncbi:PREDICTED: uncharacterized protein LOC108763668 [Trachymyrmex cornetzi]|uniref:uncharacterized protein LOC108763668 n=1 Tax=Trachymyrmex cornetzi TaxID=471704 RepID=UPI00084EEBDB|nr:PREDICTED: uncharacterized protein LOC108763668 [Trachymyrmex cornetzi]